MKAASAKSEAAYRPILLLRPAELTDKIALRNIAAEVKLGHTRPELVQRDLEFSQRLINRQASWNQGALCFCSEAFDARDRHEIGVIGGCKIEVMAATAWEKRRFVRRFDGGSKKDQLDANREYLEYVSEPRNALELGGNAVMKAHRGHGAGGFQIRARLLLVQRLLAKVAELSHISRVCGSFLTLEASGATQSDRAALKYLFYEEVVQPLFGGRTYDDIDDLRFRNRQPDGSVQFVDEFLGQRSPDRAVTLFTYPWSQTLRESFGLVREETLPAYETFKKLGFRSQNRFDVLDGGPFLEIASAELSRFIAPELYKIISMQSICIEDRSCEWFIIASPYNAVGGPLVSFRCVRTYGKRDVSEKTIMVHPLIIGLLGIRDGDVVEVVAEHKRSGSRRSRGKRA